MYRKFYSYNDMPVIKKPNPPPSRQEHIQPTPVSQKKLLPDMKTDDIILLVVFFILIMDNCEDKLLLLALGFIFFSDYFENNPS